MADVYEYIDATGVILADTSDIKSTVEGEWHTTYGADMAVTNDTPQGKIITSEIAARVSVVNNNAAVANQINPNKAGGVFLDAICALLGLYRDPATPTIVPGVTVTGQPLTILPAGSQVRGISSGAIYGTISQIQFDNTGAGTVDFQCLTLGPITCPIGDIDSANQSIVTQVLGWETVYNSIAGTAGTPQQSDASLRALRNQTLALQGISTVEAQTSGLAAVPGVLSFAYRENVASTTQTIDGIVLTAHSVWACVDGGADVDVAASLFENKTDGAGWNGAVEVDLLEPASGQTYHISFDRTVPLAIIARVTVRKGSNTTDLTQTVPQAVQDYANGIVVSDGVQLPGFVTGAQVNPFEIGAAVGAEVAGVFIVKVEVALASVGPGGYSTAELPITLKQKGSITASSVQVVIVT